MTQFFQFEADFVESLRCIPMQVRLKLDTCGIKLKLPQWHQFGAVERQSLVDLPCLSAEEIAAYRRYLNGLVMAYTGAPATELAVELEPDWMQAVRVPTLVQAKADQVGWILTTEQWAVLTPLQRFALIKLSRSSHENSNFLPALEEFLR